MKVTGPSGPTTSAPSRSGGQAAGGFTVPSTGAAAGSAATAAPSAAAGVAGVSALMALQGVEDATERRRRALRRGGGLLDRLDELKLALLTGDPDEAALDRLGRGLREDRPETAEPGLNALLDQIDLRAAVELAKAQQRAIRA